MDLSAIYSKTPKGLRARASLIGGLSSHLMKVLTHVDGNSRAETILLKFEKLTPQQLAADLTLLEQEGYIRLATVSTAPDDSWALTVNFEPMVVEEFHSEEELEANAHAQKAQQARQQEQQKAEQRAKQEARRLAAEQKAEKKAQKLREKEKVKAEAKVKAQLEQENLEKQRREQERMAQEAARLEAEAKLKAQQEAERIEQQQAEERAAKLEEEAQRKAELKAREAAEQAEAEAEAAAKEYARREIERISRESEEAQKKAETEAKAKLEAEQAARLEAERMAQAEAEQARLDAEAKALAEKIAQETAAQEKMRQEMAEAEAAAKAEAEAVAKAKAVQELKEKARLEIASVLRKAEEDRKKAAAQEKAQKLEAKRQAKAELEARLQAERQAKEEEKQIKLKALADEKAAAEAAEIARKNALEQERKQAEAEKLAADLIAKAEMEQQEALRVRLEAEEQANLAAKEQARLEMERIAHEAELARQKTTAQQHRESVKEALPKSDTPGSGLPILDDFDAAEAAEEAAFQQEEQAAERMQRTAAKTESTNTASDKATHQPAERMSSVDIRNAAIAEAAAMASVHGKARPFVSAKKIKQWLGTLSKATFIYVPVLVLLALLLINFINLRILIKPTEQLASESIGASVVIKKVHASLWPQPHLVLEDVTVGTGSHIEAVHVLPETASLFEDVKVVKSLVIEGLNIEQASFGQPLQWINNASKAKHLKVGQINLKNLTLTIRDLQLESFDGKVTLTAANTLSSIALVGNTNALSVLISPQGNESGIVLKASNWALPFNPKITFGDLTAKGLASQSTLSFSQIEGEIFGGNLTGQANIEWPEGAGSWLSTGAFKLSNANAEALLHNFGSAVTIDGKLTLDAHFSGQAREASKLASTTTTEASFDVYAGKIQGIELTRGVLNPGRQSLAGDSTKFDKLSGTIKHAPDGYQFGKLVLSSPQFSASGYININANQTVSGRVNADLAAQSRRLKASFGVSGRGTDLKSH